jgi:hypothetical protein
VLATRTRFWRAYDFMWGLHIMDLQTREETSHPVLIIFAALAGLGVVIGLILLPWRRRTALDEAEIAGRKIPDGRQHGRHL